VHEGLTRHYLSNAATWDAARRRRRAPLARHGPHRLMPSTGRRHRQRLLRLRLDTHRDRIAPLVTARDAARAMAPDGTPPTRVPASSISRALHTPQTQWPRSLLLARRRRRRNRFRIPASSSFTPLPHPRDPPRVTQATKGRAARALCCLLQERSRRSGDRHVTWRVAPADPAFVKDLSLSLPLIRSRPSPRR
jgi:hypothetical protein